MIKDEEKCGTEQERYFGRLEKTPEHQLYLQFWRKYCRHKKSPNAIQELPLLGTRKLKDPFEEDEYYFKKFFLFEPDTPPMKKISLDQAIEEDLRLLGMIPSIYWGTLGSEIGFGIYPTSFWECDKSEVLFRNLGKFFRKRRKQTPPKYFALDFFDSEESLYNLTFFGERK